MLLRFWYVICVYFLIENLNWLQDLSENVKYKVTNSKSSVKSAICFQPDRIVGKENYKNAFIVSQLIDNVYDKLEDHFNKTKVNFWKNLDQNLNATSKKIINDLNRKFIEKEEKIDKSLKEFKNDLVSYFKDENSFKNLMKKDGSYIVNHLVCFLINDKFLNYLEVFNEFGFKLFNFESKPTYFGGKLIFDHKYRSLAGLKVQAILIKKCLSESGNSNHYLFECVNNCLIAKERKSNYFYKITEKTPLTFKNETRHMHSEKQCYEKCDLRKCRFGSYLSVNTLKTVTKEVFESEVYSESKIGYWIQFISIIFLFLNASFYSLMNKLINTFIKLLFEKIKNQNLFSQLVLKAKLFIFLISLILTILISLNSAFDYIETLKNPIETEVTKFSFLPEVLSLMICIPVQLNFKRKNNLTNYKNIFEENTFEQIEKLTDGDLEAILQKIFLKKGSQIFNENELGLQRSDKVYFKRNNFTNLKLSALSRCFRIEFQIKLIMYLDLIMSSELLLELDKICYYSLFVGYHNYNITENFCQIYVLDTLASFSSKSFNHENNFKVFKKIIKRSTSFLQTNCIDYSAKKELDCLDKQNCIEKCINKEFLRKHNSLSIQSNTVIDKDEISGYNLSKIYFNDTYDSAIINECSEKFMVDDCSTGYFFESLKKIDQSRLIEINLDFETIELKEIESSLSRFLLEVLSIEILFFGTNVIGFLFYIFSLIKINEKWAKYFIFCFCLIGFYFHYFIIYESIVNAPLIDSGLFRENEKLVYPEMFFCFFYKNSKNFKIDKNIKLTGDYLDRLTSNLVFESIFEKISYINEQDQTIDLKFNSSNFESSYLKFDTFLSNNGKCFAISIKLSYEKYDFLFRKDAYPLKINFRKNTIKDFNNYYFKAKNFSLHQKNYGYLLELNKGTSLIKKYQVKTESLEIEIENQLKILKYPLSFLFGKYDENKVDDYLNNLKNEFYSRYDLFTLKFQIFKKYFTGQIEDDLFNQFFKQKYEALKEHNQISFDSSRRIFGNYIQTFYLNESEANNQADIEFSPIFFSKVTLSTTEEGLTRLTISILNILSFWFNVCPFDFHRYFKHFKHLSKVFYPFIFMHPKLIRLKGGLKIKFNNSLL